jgi:hypothetical protein
MQAPMNNKYAYSFIGAVSYYCDIRSHHSHFLALYLITGKRTFNWNPGHHKAFGAMKALILAGVLLGYPSHYLSFHI